MVVGGGWRVSSMTLGYLSRRKLENEDYSRGGEVWRNMGGTEGKCCNDCCMGQMGRREVIYKGRGEKYRR